MYEYCSIYIWSGELFISDTPWSKYKASSATTVGSKYGSYKGRFSGENDALASLMEVAQLSVSWQALALESQVARHPTITNQSYHWPREGTKLGQTGKKNKNNDKHACAGTTK
jgi:hypothetical protein